MKYKFQINKKNFDIEIANSTTFSTPSLVKVNKKDFTVQIGDKNEGEVKSIFIDGKLYEVEFIKDSKGYPKGIYVNGRYYSGELIKVDKFTYYKEQEIKSSESGGVSSFIPGNIKKIYFKEGDKVKEGDIILIHEAMKMENEIRAPKSGIIKKLNVFEGENILAGHNFFEIE